MKYTFDRVVELKKKPSKATYARVLCRREDGQDETFFVKVWSKEENPKQTEIDRAVLSGLTMKETNPDETGEKIAPIDDSPEVKLRLEAIKPEIKFMSKLRGLFWPPTT